MKSLIWIVLLLLMIVIPTIAQDAEQEEAIETETNACLGRYGDTGSNMDPCLAYATCLVMTPTANCQNPAQQEEIEYLSNRCLSGYGDFGNNAGLCRTYATCLVMNPTADCQSEQLILQYEDCQSMGRTDCEAYALLLLSKSGLPFSALSDEEAGLLSRAFRSYLDSDYEAALSYMQEIFTGSGSYSYYLLPIAYGILQSRNELHEEAIASYSMSIQLQYDNPLAYYFRAQAYGALGDTAHSARDAYRYSLQADEVLQTTFSPLEVNFESPEMQSWLAYPVVGLGISPGGDRFSDLTILEPIPVELAVLDNETLALTSVIAATSDELEFLSLVNPDSDIAFDLQRQLIPDATQYAIVRNVQGYPGMCCGEGSLLVLTDYGDYFVYSSYGYGGEAGFETRGVLFPADFADPRESLPPRICEGLPRSHFAVGDRIGFWGSLVYSEPRNDSDAFSANLEENPATIIEGPVCTEDSIWWRIEYGENNASAWIQETYNATYLELPDGYRPSTDVRSILGLDTP